MMGTEIEDTILEIEQTIIDLKHDPHHSMIDILEVMEQMLYLIEEIKND